MDDGIDTGASYWCAHSQSVDALERVLGGIAHEETPEPTGFPVYRSAAGLGAWIRYLWLGRGKRARFRQESCWR